MTAGFERIRALFASSREPQPSLRLVFDDLPVAALLLDPSGRVLYANKHLLDLLGEPESGTPRSQARTGKPISVQVTAPSIVGAVGQAVGIAPVTDGVGNTLNNLLR